MNKDVEFTRILLKNVMQIVRKHTTVEQQKSVWVYHFGRDDYEAQSTGKHAVKPNRWYGSASTAYEARANFWSQWLDKKGIKEK